MPRESSVLADICCDFCFSRDGMPFTRGVDDNKNEGTGGLLMKTQEASWRKIRPLLEEPSVVTYTSSAFPRRAWMSFHYSLMLQSLLWPLYWCILSGRISLSLSLLRILASPSATMAPIKNEIPPFRSLREKNTRSIPSLTILLAFHSNGDISKPLHLLAFFKIFFF